MSVYEILLVATDGIDYPTGKFFSTIDYAVENSIEAGYTKETSVEYFWAPICKALMHPKTKEIRVVIERKLIK